MLKFQRSAPMKIPEDMTPTPLQVTDEVLPASVDWRGAGYVTSVKDQCCWSSGGSVEKIKGKLVDLSPQNLMDCSGPYGSYGCNPGRVTDAFKYVIANKGIASEASYPYEAKNGSCRYDPNDRAATCSSYHFVPPNELDLQQAVATIGPISCIDIVQILSLFSGVFNNPRYPATGLDYWLIKNTLARNKNQMCGISKYAYYPL
uniref:Peptidase C1A papain C-terminal domain-containing protein n=1 Tax=Neogobius melanostomus TaxID=47308 RepID=A0A8C6WHG2_9GOBI